MSNQKKAKQGTKPSLQDLSLDKIRALIEEEKEGLKKDYKELAERRKLIKQYNKIKETRKKVRQGIDIKKGRKKPKTHSKIKKIKTFEEYFQECIKNKKIPLDTPAYLRKSLERAIREYDQGIMKEKSALEDFANKYVIKGESGLLPIEFFASKKEFLKEFLRNHRNIKVRFILVCLMEKKEGNAKLMFTVQDKAYFNSKTHINIQSTDVKEILKNVILTINGTINFYQQNGSGWYFKEIIHLEIHTVNYSPMKGSSYIPLPDWIMRKKAIVSLRNKDNKCFIWSILRYLHPRQKNDSRLADLKKYEKDLNTKGITFPVSIKDITRFENLNPDIPGINVFSVDDCKSFYPLRMALRDPLKTIDLFLYEEDGKYHYSLIKNFSRLFRSQITSRTKEPIQICKRCFCHYTKEELLHKHISYCSNNETVAVVMPPKDTMLAFENYHKSLPIPFVVYADFECFTKPLHNCSPNPENSYTYNYQKHEPSGFCFYVKGIVPNKEIRPITYTKTKSDDNVAEIFVNKLAELTKGIYNDFYLRQKPLRLTRQEQLSFNKAEICYIYLCERIKN